MLRYLEAVVTLELDREACTGCRMCLIVCPHAVFSVEDRKASIVDRDACMECGACALNCPANAIRVEAGVGCASGVIFSAVGKGGDCSGDACCSAGNPESAATDATVAWGRPNLSS